MAVALRGRRETHAGDDGQARVLAELLRGSRITLLLGAASSADGSHWADSLMRQLRRRASDRGLDALSAPSLPFEDRRHPRVGPIARCDTEVVVFFDDWGPAPLDALRVRLDQALTLAGWGGASTFGPFVDTLAGLNQQLGARFLFVFGRFEQFLEADPELPGVRAFTEQWLRLLDDLTVAANFLVGLSDDAEHLLARLRERIPRIDRHWVRLPPGDASPVAAGLPGASNDSRLDGADDSQFSAEPGDSVETDPAAAPSEQEWQSWIQQMRERAAAMGRGAPSAAPSTPPATMQTGDVYAAVEDMLARTAALNWQPPWSDGTARVDELPPSANAAVASPPAVPHRLDHRLVWGAVALLGLAVVAYATRTDPGRLELGPPARPAAERFAAAPQLPRIGLRIDASSQSEIARDLAGQVAPFAGTELDVVAVPEGSTAASGTAAAPGADPGLELVRYDRLRLLRDRTPAQPPRIVAPLFTEELHFLVRADSPLRAIHQMAASRINVGPAASTRADTASSAYAALFGQPLPERQADRRSLADATTALLDGRLDVLVVVAGQPARVLAGLPTDVARRLRPLPLDRRDPTTRRALQSFLPATLRAESYPGWTLAGGVPTLGVMAFLVATDTHDAETADPRQALVAALCSQLPALRAGGHPKWREVQPGLQLNTGWPDAGPLAAAWRACPVDVDAPAPVPPRS